MFKLHFTSLSIALETLSPCADQVLAYRVKHSAAKDYTVNEKEFFFVCLFLLIKRVN